MYPHSLRCFALIGAQGGVQEQALALRGVAGRAKGDGATARVRVYRHFGVLPVVLYLLPLLRAVLPWSEVAHRARLVPYSRFSCCRTVQLLYGVSDINDFRH